MTVYVCKTNNVILVLTVEAPTTIAMKQKYNRAKHEKMTYCGG